MAGEPYAAGGIRTTVAATRAATDEQLTSHVARLVDEMRRQGTTTRGDQERLRPHRPRRGAAAWRSPGSSPRRPPSSAPTSCPPGTRPRGVRRPGHRPDARGRAPHARWIDVFCEEGAFDADQARAVLAAGRGAGLRGRLHANQLGVRRRASGWPPSSAWPRSTTAPTSPTTTSTALADSGTVATLLPGVEFSTRQPYPDARRLLDAGVTVALASDCNPGSCFTSSMPFCIALAVREMGMTPAEALLVGDGRRRPGARPRRRRRDRAGQAGRPGAARRAVARPPRLPARASRSSPASGRPAGRLSAV